MNKMIRFFGKRNILTVTLLALLASAVSIFSYVYPMFFRNIVEGVENRNILDYRLLAIYAGLLLLGIILQYFGTISFNKFRLNLYYDFRTKILSSFLSLNDREKKKHGIGIYQNQITAELGHAFSILNITTFKSPILLIRVAFALYIGYLWNVQIGMIFAANIVMYLLAAFIMNRRLPPIYKDISENEPKFNAFLVEFLNGITTILNRRVVRRYLDKHRGLNDRIRGLYFKEAVNSETISLVFIDIVHIVSTISIIALSLNLYIRGDFTFGLMIAILEYFRFIVDPIDIYNRVHQQYLRSSHFVEMLLPILETERKKDNRTVCMDIKTTDKVVEIKNLSVTADEFSLIDNASFDIDRNDKVAIVGQSGEGKSIIFDILLKNITEYDGCVKFMGMNIAELERSDVLGNMGYYSQDIHIFNDDIYNNICNDDSKDTTLLDRLIRKFGLDTLKNRDLGENGINISKGEKSRIETLRLILGNKNLVLLDEPFDGLDCPTKENVLKNLNEFIENKTVIVISHDFDILKKIATKYIYIDNDKKLHIGTHEKLYRDHSSYRALSDNAQKSNT